MIIFLSTAAVFFIVGLSSIIFAKSELQEWAKVHNSNNINASTESTDQSVNSC